MDIGRRWHSAIAWALAHALDTASRRVDADAARLARDRKRLERIAVAYRRRALKAQRYA
ncbi:hypothetical protein [Hydrocarboniphaga sp.]|uniref:hypothetical protein n=1 Tax=Hydrocarboniphaga sp. TaxID=2033016 RepID=UPI003D118DB4